MFSGYLHAEGVGAIMAIENFPCSRHSLISSVYYMDHLTWARRKTFEIKILRWLQNAIWKFVFTNIVYFSFFINIWIIGESCTDLLSRIYRRCVRHSLYPESSITPTMVGPGKNIQNEGSQKTG